MLREMYASNLTEDAIKNRIVEEVDAERFRQITDSTLEGLAKRELNLSAIVGKSAEAKERRLVPEVIEDFFLQAAPSPAFIRRKSERKPLLPRRPRPADTLADRRRWSRASASWARNTSRSSSTRACCQRTRPPNGSRRAIRCSRLCGKTLSIRSDPI